MNTQLLPVGEFAKELVEGGKIQKKTAKSFSYQGNRVHIERLIQYLMDHDMDTIKNLNPEIAFLNEKERAAYSVELGGVAMELLVSKRLEKTTLANTGRYRGSVEFGLLTPAQDVLTGERYIINEVNDSISSMSYETWASLISINPDLKQEKIAKTVPSIFDYDPYNLRRRGEEVRELDEGSIKAEVFNLYTPPKWRLEGAPASYECPELVKKLLVHLFPDEGCRRYVMGWMFNMVLKRNDTYLVLNGSKGIGKGIFVESVLKALVGKEHFSKAPVGFLDTHFNSVLENNRAIYLDEQTVNTQKKHNMLKDYINPEQNIEAKFQNAKKSKQTYNSFIISNNSTADIYIKWDDRRFSVIDLTETDLREVMTQTEIRELTDRLANDMEYQKQLGHWVLNSCEDHAYSSFDAWRGPSFWRLAILSLSEWQRYIYELFLDNPIGSTWSFQDLQRGYKRVNPASTMTFPRQAKVNEFITEFYFDGTEERIGAIGVDEFGKWQVTSFIGLEEASNDDEELGFL